MTYNFEDGNGPVPAHKHPKGGGWVADTAKVDDTAFVGPDARVSGNAWVSGNAQVFENAKVNKGTITSGIMTETLSEYYNENAKTAEKKKDESHTTIIMSAEEAKKRTKKNNNNSFKDFQQMIQNEIAERCEDGESQVTFDVNDILPDILKTVCNELKSLGYDVKANHGFRCKLLQISWE